MPERERSFVDPLYWRKAAEQDQILKQAFEVSLESFLMAHIVKHRLEEERASLQRRVADCESLEELEKIAKEFGVLEEFLKRDEVLRIFLDWQSNPDFRPKS